MASHSDQVSTRLGFSLVVSAHSSADQSAPAIDWISAFLFGIFSSFPQPLSLFLCPVELAVLSNRSTSVLLGCYVSGCVVFLVLLCWT